MSKAYEMVIGLETHVELRTRSKVFCACPNVFGAEPNTHVCPVCMGLPGALPVFNAQVLRYAAMAGMALRHRRGPPLAPPPAASTARITSIPTCPRRIRSASSTARCARGER